jgi:hypothetical protein
MFVSVTEDAFRCVGIRVVVSVGFNDRAQLLRIAITPPQ